MIFEKYSWKPGTGIGIALCDRYEHCAHGCLLLSFGKDGKKEAFSQTPKSVRVFVVLLICGFLLEKNCAVNVSNSMPSLANAEWF
jgi:hypothetical protein